MSLYSTNYIADLLGVKKITVCRWAREGKIRANHYFSKHEGWCFTEESLRAFLDDHPKYKRRLESKEFDIRDKFARELMTRVKDPYVANPSFKYTPEFINGYRTAIENVLNEIQNIIEAS